MAGDLGPNGTALSDVSVISNITGRQTQWVPSPSLVNFYRIMRGIDLYFVPCVIVIGLIGNSLSFCVFVTSHLRRQSSSAYLAALAVSDTGVLVCIFFNWSTNIGVNLIHTDGWCQSSIYFTYVWGFLSVWFVVGFTVERYIAVCHPLRRQNLCTTRKAKIVVVSLSVAAVVLHLYATWTSGVQPYLTRFYCMPLMQSYKRLVTIMNIVDTVLTFLVPSIVILILNSLIVQAVVRVKRQRQDLNVNHLVRPVNSTGSLNTASATTNRSVDRRATSCLPNSSQIKVTKMLVIVSSTFLALNLPNHSIRVYAFVLSLTDSPLRSSHAHRICQNIFQYIYYINFSINFFLYNACGRNFRRALRHMCSKVLYKITRVFTKSSSDNIDNIELKQRAANAPLTAATRGKKSPKSSSKSSRSSKSSKRSSHEEEARYL